jgi:F420-non-reducing hydrogenase iron-sulfur subunit
MSEFNPTIIAFVCNWCSYAGADLAGGQKLEYPSCVKLVRVMCSGRVDPQEIFETFRKGADGVMVLGCHPGDCHYRNGNMKTLRRMRLLQKTMAQFGIDPDRLMLDWVSAGEGEKFQEVTTLMAQRITAMGPLKIKGSVDKGVLS